MAIPFMAIGAGINLLGSIGRGILGGKQKRMANQIHPSWSQYITSPYAKQQLGIAQQMFNGRAAGAGSLENNIYGNQASTQANVNRNATSSAQALALAGGIQGQTNEAFQNLQTKEAQNKQAMLANLNQAYGTNINEGDKEYQSKLLKYQMDLQQQAALRGAGVQNQFGALNDIAGLMASLDKNQQQNAFWKQAMAQGGTGNSMGGGLGSGIFG